MFINVYVIEQQFSTCEWNDSFTESTDTDIMMIAELVTKQQ